MAEKIETERSGKWEQNHNPNWNILPPEVWCLILDENVKEPQDLANLLLASPLMWDEILSPRKSDFLLPFVLPIIFKGDKHLENSDLLNLRLVCSSWKQYVESFLGRHPCLVNLDGINHEKKDCCTPIHTDSSFCWQRATRGVQSIDEIHHITEYVLSNPRSNPLMTRSFEFRDFVWNLAATGEIDPILWASLRVLLRKIGPSILHFRFLSAAQRTGPVFYMYIRELLNLLPNLRTLRFWFVAGPGDLMTPQCEALIQRHPLPELKHLHVLKCFHLPTVIMNALLRSYSGQLEKLEIFSIGRHSHLYSYDDTAIKFSAILNEISIRLWTLNDIWKLNSAGLLQSPLKSINIFIDLSSDRDNLEKLFYVLSTCKCNALVENLSIEILVDTFGPLKRMLDPQVRLNLPSLKKLKLTCKFRCLNTIDFILSMGSLEELAVHMEDIRIMNPPGCTYGGFSPETLKFIGLEDSLYESNVWAMLPRLRKIEITDEVLDEEDNGNSFFDRDTSTRKRKFAYSRTKWEEQTKSQT